MTGQRRNRVFTASEILARNALALVTTAHRVCVRLPAVPIDLDSAVTRLEETIAVAARLSLRDGIRR